MSGQGHSIVAAADGAGSLGLPSGIVLVVPYDDAWPALFEREATRLRPIFEAHGVSHRIEHMGSTAVPGLAAKPILDILAGRPADARDAAIAALREAGYTYRGEQGIPGRDFFRRGDPRAYHVHLADIDGAFWKDHLAFRDYLRSHADAAAAYAALKHELAARYPNERAAYIDGKTTFVEVVLAKVRS